MRTIKWTPGEPCPDCKSERVTRDSGKSKAYCLDCSAEWKYEKPKAGPHRRPASDFRF